MSSGGEPDQIVRRSGTLRKYIVCDRGRAARGPRRQERHRKNHAPEHHSGTRGSRRRQRRTPPRSEDRLPRTESGLSGGDDRAGSLLPLGESGAEGHRRIRTGDRRAVGRRIAGGHGPHGRARSVGLRTAGQADSVAAEDPRLRTAGRDPFGRTAQARGAGQRADKRVGPADPRRADQPPRHRYDRVARRVSGGKRRGAADGDARPLLSGQGVQRHPRNRGPAAIPLRGQLLLLSGEEAGARDGAGGPAGERNESLPPRAGVDAPPAAGAGDEGPVAHRRLSRAGNAPAIDAQPRRSAARRQGVADRDQDIRSQGGRQTVRRAGAPRQIQLQLHPLRETGDRGRQRLREIDVPQTADGDRTP